MKKILTRGGVELIAIVLGITLSLWVDDKKELSVIKKNNVKTLESLKNEIRLRIDYIDRKIIQKNQWESFKNSLIQLHNPRKENNKRFFFLFISNKLF